MFYFHSDDSTKEEKGASSGKLDKAFVTTIMT